MEECDGASVVAFGGVDEVADVGARVRIHGASRGRYGPGMSRFHVTVTFDVAVEDLNALELRAAEGGNVLSSGDPAVNLLAVLGNALDDVLLGAGVKVLGAPGQSIQLEQVD